MSAQRISRLASRAIGAFETVIAKLSRRGRPGHQEGVGSMRAELALTSALLDVATSILKSARVDRRQLRALVVGAWLRLHPEHGVTQSRFCKALSLPDRTLRSWLKQPPARQAPQPPQPDKPGKPKRPPRRGRFGFNVLLPDTQIAGDTTDLCAFGVDLKLIAAQDVGGRDEALLDEFVVETDDNSEHVVQVLTAALSRLPGAQAITDQGTPYIATATRQALDALRVEHAPQREGDPLGKSTLERAFRTLKSIADPVLQLTNRVAALIPALRNTELAKCAVQLIMTALLRAYQHGARAARRAEQARGSISPETLVQLAEQSRQQAFVRDDSARQLLAYIHSSYQLEGSEARFVSLFRSYPMQVLHDAERAFRKQVHRDDIRNRVSYFGAIVRAEHELYLRDQRRHRRERQEHERRTREQEQQRAQRQAHCARPADWLREALEMVAAQWLPAERQLLFDGQGAGLGAIRASLARLVTLHGTTAALDIASTVMADFEATRCGALGPDALRAVRRLLERESERTKLQADPCPLPNTPAMLGSLGRNPRPPPSARLRN